MMGTVRRTTWTRGIFPWGVALTLLAVGSYLYAFFAGSLAMRPDPSSSPSPQPDPREYAWRPVEERTLRGYGEPVRLYVTTPPCWYWRIEAPQGTAVCWESDGECGSVHRWWGTRTGWGRFYGPQGETLRLYIRRPKPDDEGYRRCMGWDS